VIGIYIDLDAILDTRFGILYNISPKLAARIYSEKYLERHSDNFSLMSNIEFSERYRNRDNGVIRTPFPTHILKLLGHHALGMRQDSILKGGNGAVKVFLNIHPYNLSTSEIKLLENGLLSKLPETTVVEVVNDSLLIPKTIKLRNIKTVIKYDGVSWINTLVSKSLIRIGEINDVELIVPDIVDTPLHEKFNEENAMTDIARIFAGLINLTYISVAMFSFVSDIKRKEE